VCVCACMCVCVWMCACACACEWVSVTWRIHMYFDVCVRVCERAHVYVCVCVCVSARACEWVSFRPPPTANPTSIKDPIKRNKTNNQSVKYFVWKQRREIIGIPKLSSISTIEKTSRSALLKRPTQGWRNRTLIGYERSNCPLFGIVRLSFVNYWDYWVHIF